MKFGPQNPPRRAMQDRAIVPMINVVFLLLIFFLMSATLAPPQPFEVTPPAADGAETDPQPLTLYVGTTGQLAYDGASGEAVWDRLALHEGALPLRVDAALEATDLAQLLSQLGQSGIEDIRLLTVRP